MNDRIRINIDTGLCVQLKFNINITNSSERFYLYQFLEGFMIFDEYITGCNFVLL